MPNLELERNDRFTATERRLHRVTVAVMALVVLAGALGLFGFGPLASATVSRAGFTVTYERFSRNGAPFSLEAETTDPEMRVWIDDALLDALALDRVLPAPSRERRTARGTTFVFAASAGAQPRATFAFTGDAVGLVRGHVGRSPDQAMPVSVIFYP